MHLLVSNGIPIVVWLILFLRLKVFLLLWGTGLINDDGDGDNKTFCVRSDVLLIYFVFDL